MRLLFLSNEQIVPRDELARRFSPVRTSPKTDSLDAAKEDLTITVLKARPECAAYPDEAGTIEISTTDFFRRFRIYTEKNLHRDARTLPNKLCAWLDGSVERGPDDPRYEEDFDPAEDCVHPVIDEYARADIEQDVGEDYVLKHAFNKGWLEHLGGMAKYSEIEDVLNARIGMLQNRTSLDPVPDVLLPFVRSGKSLLPQRVGNAARKLFGPPHRIRLERHVPEMFSREFLEERNAIYPPLYVLRKKRTMAWKEIPLRKRKRMIRRWADARR